MATQNEYWFNIEGKIYAEDEDEAYENLHKALSGKVERAFYNITENK